MNDFQDKIKALTGKEAALFVVSGTQGNQICLRTHLHQPPHTILLDYRAHVQTWETGAIPVLSQATVTSVEPKNGVHLTLDDVKDRIIEEGNCKKTLPKTLPKRRPTLLILSQSTSPLPELSPSKTP